MSDEIALSQPAVPKVSAHILQSARLLLDHSAFIGLTKIHRLAYLADARRALGGDPAKLRFIDEPAKSYGIER